MHYLRFVSLCYEHTHTVVLSTSITLQDVLRGWMSLPCLYASTSGRREGQEREEKEEEEEGRGRRRKRGGGGEGLRDEPPYIVVGYLNFITFSTYF